MLIAPETLTALNPRARKSRHRLQALDADFDPAHHEAMFAMEMPGKDFLYSCFCV